MTNSELILLLTGVNITQYTIHGISEIGTMVQMDGYNDLLFSVSNIV